MKKVQVPEGNVRVRCEHCRKFHIVRMGEYYVCPKTIENSTHWYIVFVCKDEIYQTSNFKNVKVWLDLN